MRPRLMILAVGLGVGGAEELIRQSIPLLEAEGFDVSLRSILRGGRILDEIRETGADAAALGSGRTGIPRALARLARELRSGRYDLIHSHLLAANLAARLVGRAVGVPAIVNSHHGADAWNFRGARALDRLTARCADRILVCSEYLLRVCRDEVGLPAGKLVTVPNGIDPTRFDRPCARAETRAALGLPGGAPVLGTVGRLDEPVKGTGVLLEAMALLRDRIPGAICVVAGSGPALSRLQDHAARAGLGERVRFVGERRDVPDLLRAFDLYVQPSRREAFGLSTLEAMACGLPVVASATGGLAELVEPGTTGELAEPGDPRSLAGAIQSLLSDPERARACGERGRAKARRYTLGRMVRGWSGVYRETLGRRGARRAA
jgi:glycosyltransferase involved in cell wall biosynthesis